MTISSVKTGAIGDSLLAGNAAFNPSSFESIATVTSSGGVSTLSFTSIPSTYVALQIRGSNLQSENGTTGSYGFYIGFNSDTSTNYAQHEISGNGTSPSASGTASSTPPIVGRYSRNSESAKGAAIIDIHDYTSATKNKTLRSFAGLDLNGTGIIYTISGLWMNTSAITSIQFTGNGNWKTGSTFALYGIKGA
jgi:hypothetical protein